MIHSSDHEQLSHSEATSAASLLKRAMSALKASNWLEAEELLLVGISKYPDALDAHDDPMFRKELVRHLVKHQRWVEAKGLVSVEILGNQNGWHHILFARALDALGKQSEARKHWEEFVKTRPRHQEALAALAGMSIENYERQFSILPSPLGQIKREVPSQQFEVILDVGANEGQSCVPYAQALPHASIYAFEPIPATFDKLVRNLEQNRNVLPVNIALGSYDGTVDITAQGTSTMNRVSKANKLGLTIEIASTTSERFCKDRGIAHVDFLKIDTEGYDLDVLRGCGDFLARIDFVQCEASANLYNKYHVAFSDIFEYLSARNFYLFFIDGATYEWANGGYPILRRFDPVFINANVVGELKGVIDR